MNNKKEVRDAFRNAVFARDKNACVMCGLKPAPGEIVEKRLNCHHIEDRHHMPNGGYVPENGITLCASDTDTDNCHWKAERYHATGTAHPGYSPDELTLRQDRFVLGKGVGGE